MAGMFTRCPLLHIRHLPIGSSFDHVYVGLEGVQPEEAIMVRRLILRRNAKPFMVRVEHRLRTSIRCMHKMPPLPVHVLGEQEDLTSSLIRQDRPNIDEQHGL